MPKIKTEPLVQEARETGLHYSSDEDPGYSRKLQGRHFAFFSTKGVRIKDPAEIERIRKLAIPPAYKNVWICRIPRVTCRPRAATIAGGSSTVITPSGGSSAMKQSSSTC